MRTFPPSPAAPVILGRGFGDEQFVRCEPGRFTMGWTLDPNNPPHEVTLTRAFWLQKTPVTQAQWVAVMGSNPSHFSGNDLRPVEKVSWEDVQGFLRALNQQTGKVIRLPTEAEWEYACRVGKTFDFFGTRDDFPIADYAWFDSNCAGTTQPVSTLLPNTWGLYDMQGNVYEWCQDWASRLSTARVQDPSGASSGECRVARGGSWSGDADNARLANRMTSSPSFRSIVAGFRLARTL